MLAAGRGIPSETTIRSAPLALAIAVHDPGEAAAAPVFRCSVDWCDAYYLAKGALVVEARTSDMPLADELVGGLLA
ncbi:MAG: hypothetical protein ERJ67_09200 [Aphanocapsa feldmannii 277cV]|uniref:Uncharacterized protein n=1 Tax=Aphanocapsa feldmannii 277cV TaxID=2507553 RepID=A0A524RLG7_9CHRO|nr:MAG: hypothetical protein ERJ67_09200 [Aphanocapsa feldmannii 277cV]